MTPGTALLVRRARHDPGVIEQTHVLGTRSIRRGVRILLTTPIAAALGFGLGDRLSDWLAAVVGYSVISLGLGLGWIIVGARRRALASHARHALEARRLPVAQLIR